MSFDEIYEKIKQAVTLEVKYQYIDFDGKKSNFSKFMIKTLYDVLKNINFDSPVKRILDYWLWIQVAKNNDFYYLDEKLTNWRMHKNSYIKANSTVWSTLWPCFIFDKERKKLMYDGLKLKIKFLALIIQYLKYVRRNIIRISFRERSINLFGKVYSLKTKNTI